MRQKAPSETSPPLSHYQFANNNLMLSKIFSLLQKKEKIQCSVLFIAIVFRSLIEVAGVVSIMPFIAVVSNPGIISSNQYLSAAYAYFNFQSPRLFLITLGLCVFCFIIANNVLSATTEWFLVRFTWLQGHEIARRLLAKYLAQPYAFFLNENSSTLGANILNEVSYFLKGILRPIIEMVAKLIVSLFLFVLLALIDPILATVMGCVLGSAYSLIFLAVRKKLARVGKERVLANQRQFLYIGEALTGIKDIKVRGCERFFLEAFSKHSYRVNMNQAVHQIVSQVPRFALEIIAFGGILLITLYFVITEKNTANTIPLMALYAFAGYRLMPALQSVFSGITTIRFNLALLDRLARDLAPDTYPHRTIASWSETMPPMRLRHAIELRGLCFTYPGAETPTLNALNLKIDAKTTVGFAGPTGAGKTTLIDIILGLFPANQGELVVDGTPIDASNLRAWLGSIGYVPQQIFLSDQSVRRNIAFGLPEEEIDDQSVEQAARIAHLHNFIIGELPDGYDTLIGERGIRLSGGQRQRIGIARAMYHNPDVLILDEATSALDTTTEAGVMEAIKGLARKKTILMIAHRLTTLIDCDVIHLMEQGRVVRSGDFQQLLADCPAFRQMRKD
jgi:ATP-binding cassette, subfamily B, bacterial PglK